MCLQWCISLVLQFGSVLSKIQGGGCFKVTAPETCLVLVQSELVLPSVWLIIYGHDLDEREKLGVISFSYMKLWDSQCDCIKI